MRTANVSILLLVAGVVAAGCTSTKLANTWRDPNFSGPIAFKKTLVVAIYKDEAVRREAEDAMVRAIGPDRAVAAYQVIAETDRATASALEAKAKSIGADGLVTMRVIGTRTETNLVPSDDPGFVPFYDRSMTMATAPTYQTDHIVSVETRIYSVADGKLIWSGTSDTIDVSDVDKTVTEIANAVRAELQREKLLTA
jgi:hypothetical protein